MARILVVEDDPAMAEVVRSTLADDGHVAEVHGDGVSALIAARAGGIDAAAIDVMLPEMTGFELCRRLREGGAAFPILMLTARDAVEDRVRGLDVGADDYLTKPFALVEFSARMRALLRRHEASPRTRLRVGDLDMDLETDRTSAAGSAVVLTRREQGLLRVLLARAGEVVTREELLTEVWGTTHIDPTIVDQYVRYVRRKLEAAGASTGIDTVRGRGYTIPEQAGEPR